MFTKGALHLRSYFFGAARLLLLRLTVAPKEKKKKKDSDTFFFFPLQYERTESFLLRPSAAVSLNVSKLTGNSLGLFLEGTRRMLFLFKHRRWAGVWEGSDRRAF